jgi:hypothetical protein
MDYIVMPLYDEAFHMSIEKEERPQAQRLADYIQTYIKPSAFYDFGCSSGLYLREIKARLPLIESKGFEFSKEAVDRALCGDVIQMDLTEPLTLTKPPNTLGLCLEVLEHIPDEHHGAVLSNLTKGCDTLIFSAALPGQGGTGHINCRPRIDWISRFHALGWVVDVDATQHLVAFIVKGLHMGWLRENVMVFVPAGRLGYHHRHY